MLQTLAAANDRSLRGMGLGVAFRLATSVFVSTLTPVVARLRLPIRAAFSDRFP